MEFKTVIQERFSCKNFADTKITTKQLQDILNAGRLAPTAKNNQEQRIYVIQSKSGLEKIDKLTPCRYGATTVIMVAYDKNAVFTYPGQKFDSGIEDATIVATHMLLAAKDAGVDSCWVNFFNPDYVHEEFSLPENESVLMFLMLGHAADNVKPLPTHEERKPLNETVVYL